MYTSQWISFPTQTCLVLYYFYSSLLHSLIMWLIVSSLLSHNLHLLFCQALIFALLELVFMVLFWVTNKRDSVPFLKFSFFYHLQVFSNAISSFCRLKCLLNSFSNFCFLAFADLLFFGCSYFGSHIGNQNRIIIILLINIPFWEMMVSLCIWWWISNIFKGEKTNLSFCESFACLKSSAFSAFWEVV